MTPTGFGKLVKSHPFGMVLEHRAKLVEAAMLVKRPRGADPEVWADLASGRGRRPEGSRGGGRVWRQKGRSRTSALYFALY